VAVVEDGRRELVNLIYSQEALHRGFGGVVPEVAARAHLEKLPALVTEALDRAALEGITDPHQLQQIVRRIVGRWVNDTYRRRPMIVPNVVEV